MSILVTCFGCRKTLSAPDAAAGLRIKCPACATILSVPALPDAVPIALEPVDDDDDAPAPRPRPRKSPAPAESPVAAGPSVWLIRGLLVAIFLGFCFVFAIVGAARNPDDPMLGASRMARTVGAPLALLVIAAVEIVLWLSKSARSAGSQEERALDRRRRSL